MIAVSTQAALSTVLHLGHLVPFAYIQNFPSGTMPRFVMPAYFMLILAIPLAWSSILTLVKRPANVEKS